MFNLFNRSAKVSSFVQATEVASEPFTQATPEVASEQNSQTPVEDMWGIWDKEEEKEEVTTPTKEEITEIQAVKEKSLADSLLDETAEIHQLADEDEAALVSDEEEELKVLEAVEAYEEAQLRLDTVRIRRKAAAESLANTKTEALAKVAAMRAARAAGIPFSQVKAEAKAKADAEAKAIADAKVKADLEAKAMADAKAKAEADALTKAKKEELRRKLNGWS